MNNHCSNPKVTINVPVYNVESYLPQCLDSLLNQTLREIEILLVDDGSTDNSGRICDEYALKDSRIRVFHKKNGGLASVRQYALERANGEYFISCDSDDWIEPIMYEELYREANRENADIVICDFFYNYPNGKQVQAENIPKDCSQDTLLKDVLMRRLSGTTCSKLFRKDVFCRYQLSWEDGINLGEDLFMFLKLLQCPLKIVCIPKALYHYRRILGSNTYTNNLSFNSFKQAEEIFLWQIEHIDQQKYAKEMFSSALDYAFIGIRAKNMPPKYYKEFVNKHLPYSKFFSCHLFTRKYFLILSSKIFGTSFARSIFCLLYKFVYR